MRLSRFSSRLLVALIPALILGSYARWPAMAFLPYIALVPWVVLYTDDRRPRVSSGYYFLGAYASWILLYPQASRFGWLPPFALGAVFVPPMLVFGPLLRRIHHRFDLPRTLTVPLIWVAVEWLRATFTVGHFDLYRLGVSQARFRPLIQIADVAGVYGVSFLVAAVNGLLGDGFFALRDRYVSHARARRTVRLRTACVLVVAGYAAVLLYGAYRLGTVRQTDGPRVAVVQPNIRHTIRNVVGVHLSQVALTSRALARAEAALIVWPENAIMDDLRRDTTYLEDLGWLARTKQARLLVGALGEVQASPGKSTNTAYLVGEGGEIQGEYVKLVLMPWSEYVPGDRLLRWLSPSLQRAQRTLVREAWGFIAPGVPGERMALLQLPWGGGTLPFGALICHESCYPPLHATARRFGARFFVNITSEGLVGGPLQEQLLRLCILRAVENRVPYVRAGNTGISCFIDATGRVRSVLRGVHGRTIDDAGVLVDRLHLTSGGATLYARSRDAFAGACVLTTLVLLGWSFRRRGGGSPFD